MEKIYIDCTKGGNGDIWMRLVGLASFSTIIEKKIVVQIPPFIYNLANYTFGQFFEVTKESLPKSGYQFTSKGIRHIWKEIITGKKMILPYQRYVFHDKRNKKFKDYLNQSMFEFLGKLSFVFIPKQNYYAYYQGFADIIAIKEFRDISYDQFLLKNQETTTIVEKLLSFGYPISSDLKLPLDLSESEVIFPNGTSRQFVPIWWAKKYKSEAYYAIFFKDPEFVKFEKAGLKTLPYYNEPGDIIAIGQTANIVYSTDSFPSHILQSAVPSSKILLTEVLKSKITNPAFKGKVTESLAPCHPCLHLAKNINPLCEAGHSECVNWKNEQYINNILA